MLLVAQAQPRDIRNILSTRKLSQKHAIWRAARPRTSVSTALHTTREIVCRFVAFFSVTVGLLNWTHGVFYGSVKHRVCVRTRVCVIVLKRADFECFVYSSCFTFACSCYDFFFNSRPLR